MADIEGRLVPLSGGRMVFLANVDDKFYLGFKNSDGEDTKLCLSREAMERCSYDHVSNPRK